MSHVVKKKKKATLTKKRGLRVDVSFYFWNALDYWTPPGPMQPSRLSDVGTVNNLDLGTNKLKLEFYSKTHDRCDPNCVLGSLQNYFS